MEIWTEKVTNPKAMKFSGAKIIGCLMLLIPLIATILISYILSSWNWHLIVRDYHYSSITKKQETNSGCNLFIGNWNPSSYEPYYTNTSNCIIDSAQNCMTTRPDTEFMKWRWKPDDCELPRFNAALFLELMRGKTMAFIGDSLARNHVQSLTCMLTQAEIPVDMGNDDWKVRRFRFVKYNFTIENLWSVYLVESEDADTSIYARFSKALYLDEADEVWTSYIQTFDYVIISSAHWFRRPLVYYRNGKVVGCYECKNNTIANLGMYYGYRNAFKTAYRALLDSNKFKGTIFLRTFSPRHFENGKWYSGGRCLRTSPTEIGMEDYEVKLYQIAIEELKAAEKIGRKKGLKFGILDLTQMMTMRPDAHPDRYGRGFSNNKTAADCLHWCLPGAIDTWNEILLQLLLR